MDRPIIHPPHGFTEQHDPGFYVLRQNEIEIGTLNVGQPNEAGVTLETWNISHDYTPPPAHELIEFLPKPSGRPSQGDTRLVSCSNAAPPEETGIGGPCEPPFVFAPGIYWILQDGNEVGRLVIEPLPLTNEILQHWHLYLEAAPGEGSSGNPRRPYRTPGPLGSVTNQYKLSEGYRRVRLDELLPEGSPPTRYIRAVERAF